MHEGPDVLIVGAGPSGAMAALLCARAGLETVLVEKAAFPRYKVCGSCISADAMSVLNAVGLKTKLVNAGAMPLSTLELRADNFQIKYPLKDAFGLSRGRFDSLLVDEAVNSGASFVAQTKARLLSKEASYASDRLSVELLAVDGTVPYVIQPKLLLIADGISGTTLSSLPEYQVMCSADSRIGVGTLLTHSPQILDNGAILMSISECGYIGLVRVENGQTNVAAALNPEFLRQFNDIGPAAAVLMERIGVAAGTLFDGAKWKGTATLTRRRKRLSGERVFIIGDAAGYVEPFTGEGIAWSLMAAKSVLPIVQQAVSCWRPSLAPAWEREYRNSIGKRHQRMSLLMHCLRHRSFISVAAKLAFYLPGINSLVGSLVSSSVNAAREDAA